jgi:hypothetical protein
MIAALYVEPNGAYWGLDGVDPWDEARDARLYNGPYPVICHPPCARWGRYFFGGPTIVRHGRPYLKLGDDEGCFQAALIAVRTWGGVLEHPEGSHAWRHFGLAAPPRSGGWVAADFDGGWTCCIEQGAYGHPARKRTWLYARGVDLPSLAWGVTPGKFDIIDASAKGDRARQIKTGILQQMSKRQRAATPLSFRDLLVSIAETAALTALSEFATTPTNAAAPSAEPPAAAR